VWVGITGDEEAGLAVAIFLPILMALGLVCVAGWVASSYLEASAFNRITGSSTTTWEAMFVELRIQEQTQ
jgi:hypothetical protein